MWIESPIVIPNRFDWLSVDHVTGSPLITMKYHDTSTPFVSFLLSAAPITQSLKPAVKCMDLAVHLLSFFLCLILYKGVTMAQYSLF